MTGSTRSSIRRSSLYHGLTTGKLHFWKSFLLFLCTEHDDRTVRIYDAATGATSGEAWTTEQAGYIMAIVISPDDNKVLAAGSDDNTIVLYDMDKRSMINQPLRGHTQ